MSTIVLGAGNGGALGVVNGDGTVDVWSVPQGATIAITGQRGFGNAVQLQAGVGLTDAAATIQQQLGQDGAVG